jgi:hypothetical protein
VLRDIRLWPFVTITLMEGCYVEVHQKIRLDHQSVRVSVERSQICSTSGNAPTVRSEIQSESDHYDYQAALLFKNTREGLDGQPSGLPQPKNDMEKPNAPEQSVQPLSEQLKNLDEGNRENTLPDQEGPEEGAVCLQYRRPQSTK